MSRRQYRRLHRRIATGALVLILWFSLSGMLLNHAHDLGFDEQALPSAVVLALYGEDLPEDLPAWRVGEAWVVALDDTLYYDNRAVGACPGGIRGAVAPELAAVDVAVACSDAVHLLDRNGNRVDRIDASWGLSGEIVSLSLSATAAPGIHRLAIADRDGTHCVNDTPGTLTPCTATRMPSTPVVLPDSARSALATALQPPAIDFERLVHDLHSGRLFGPPARWVWDLFALALLALAGSGLALLLRRHP